MAARPKIRRRDNRLVPALRVGARYPAAQRRQGGVYIAVLGSSLIIALLGMCALIGQRIENRLVVASSDIRQAQLNASTAVELAMLAMKQDTNWRTTYTSGAWFTKRSTGIGSCTANVVDPVDGTLGGGTDDPVQITGIGYSGGAEQRMQVTVDPKKNPYSCLRSAVAAGGNISVSSGKLRTNGLTTANQITATSAQVYGNVEATSISGSTYNGTTTTVTSDKRPTMPDWTSAFQYYRDNATSLDINSFPTTMPNLGRNTSFDVDTSYWTGTATGLPTATLEQKTGVNGHSACARVKDRVALTSGASQAIDQFVKMGVSYNITIQICPNSSWGNIFRVKLATKGTLSSVVTAQSSTVSIISGVWQDVNVTLTAPVWSGNLEYARVTIDTDSTNPFASTNDFYIDGFDIRENLTARFIYRQVLGPGINTLYAGAPLNSQGIYKIDCGGQRLIIERSRIVGTLLVVNPGANSCVKDGPISWKPAVAGYPALLVDADTPTTADFAILATNRALGEKENGVNYNPSGAPSDEFGQDTDMNDIYSSHIKGLIAVRHDLTYQNRALIKGQVIVGNNITNNTGELEIDYQPDSLLNPPPGFWSYTYARRTGSTKKVVLP
jgi:hypothetical protein